MTENESLKTVIKCKDDSIKELCKSVLDCSHQDFVISTQKDTIKRLESKVQSLREKTNEDYYKKLYNEALEDQKETMRRGLDFQIKFEKAEGMVHKLLTIVTFTYGLLNIFQAKRVFRAFGKFNVADYRI
jgi:hypothetical protein